MRVLFGIVLGIALTIGVAYVYDSTHAAMAASTPTISQRPLVNWDVVAFKWHELAARARTEWRRLAKAS